MSLCGWGSGRLPWPVLISRTFPGRGFRKPGGGSGHPLGWAGLGEPLRGGLAVSPATLLPLPTAPPPMIGTWVPARGRRQSPLQDRTALPHLKAWSLAVGRFSVPPAMMLEGSRKKELFSAQVARVPEQ